MFIEIEGYQGSLLLLQVAEIVSVSVHYDDEESKYYTAIRMKGDPIGENGVINSFDSAESYESIKSKILGSQPKELNRHMRSRELGPCNILEDVGSIEDNLMLKIKWQDSIIKSNSYNTDTLCPRSPGCYRCGDIHGNSTAKGLDCGSCALEGLYRLED